VLLIMHAQRKHGAAARFSARSDCMGDGARGCKGEVASQGAPIALKLQITVDVWNLPQHDP
jgi:hypothetical protein